MLKNAFLPDGSKSPTILKSGSIQEVTDTQAEILIDKKYAAEVKSEKPAKSDTPDDTWTIPDLKKYAEEKKIDLGKATKKDEILAAIAAAKPVVTPTA
jgi:hypothetical protein